MNIYCMYTWPTWSGIDDAPKYRVVYDSFAVGCLEVLGAVLVNASRRSALTDDAGSCFSSTEVKL